MKIEIGNYRFRFDLSIKKIVEVSGINSNTDDTMNKHILLWDFDNVRLNDVTSSLSKIQDYWKLPKIYIVQSSKNRFHAYSFFEVDLSTAMAIISSTPLICKTFFKMGVMRDYWTLRITPKKEGEKFNLVRVLPSPYRAKERLDLVRMLETVKYKTEGH